MPCLLKMVAGGSIFNKSAVYVITPMFERTEIFKYRAEFIMEPSPNIVIWACIKQRRGLY